MWYVPKARRSRADDPSDLPTTPNDAQGPSDGPSGSPLADRLRGMARAIGAHTDILVTLSNNLDA